MINVKELFSPEIYDYTFGNGKNKVLLHLLEYEVFKEIFPLTYDTIVQEVANKIFIDVFSYCRDSINLYNQATSTIKICGFKFYSSQYIVEGNGVCFDRDINSIRYTNVKNLRVFKMKASKFFHKVTENIIFLPKEVIHWLAEEFANKRKALLVDQSLYSLHYGKSLKDFQKIYSEGIHSCMSGGEHANFYVNSVDATAAWLEDSRGTLVARCVIFNNVRDTGGNIYRLAERQYAEQDWLKELLVLKLITNDLIDGYKKIGAGACANKNFYTKDHQELPDKYLTIDCYLYTNSIVSYQDSFKWYNDSKKEAYNFCPIQDLATTSLRPITHDTFIKCPNCGNYFRHRLYAKDNLFYCNEKCLAESKTDFLDNNEQKCVEYQVLKYNSSLKKRELTAFFNLLGSFKFKNHIYSGYSTKFEDIEIPTEKIIQQFDLKGQLLAEYPNLEEIVIKHQFKSLATINKCLAGKCKTAYKFIWKYKGFQ